ncbi:MAG: CcmD family protein [Gemmatimonadetes bacterium]|nr:CcmD family protein [Gemmatimonadota bacterium]
MSASVRRRAAALGLALLLALPAGAAAQMGPEGLSGQTLGRGYLHVFLAYAVAWALVLGWVVSIARRRARVEHRLDEER